MTPIRLLLVLLFAVAIAAAPARAASAPDAGRAFEPAPLSKPEFETKPPEADPANQRHFTTAADGTRIFTETWLPKQKAGGPAVPDKVPTVLIVTPYVKQGVEEYPGPGDEAPGPDANDTKTIGAIDFFTRRGFAVAQSHVRGTGESGGCLEQTASKQIDDTARVVEYLGRDAPWTNGNVGMYGISYDAETQISVAGRGDPAKTSYLKAIVPAASVGGQYEYSFFDGVPYAGQALLSNTFYLGAVSVLPGDTSGPQQYVQKLECQDEIFLASADQSGDHTPFWKDREYRTGAPNIRAATLFVHGLADWNVQPITIAGFYDRLPDTTPHKGLFGVWNHAFPDRHSRVQPEWERADWLPMVLAWYDRYLKGHETKVEEWPDVQVQSTDGQWRSEPDFPTTGGPAGQLALKPGGVLGGAGDPTGSTAFTEGIDDFGDVPGTRAVFTTPKLSAPLQLTGQPVLDLLVKLDKPDAHVGARLQVLGPDGNVIRHLGSSRQAHETYGFRSLQHLDPIPPHGFDQTRGKAAPTGKVLRVPVRFHPNDLRVPAGGQLRLIVAGAVRYSRSSEPSGSATRIELLHSCENPSALRFLTPRPEGELLNVRERDEKEALTSVPTPVGPVDGGGLASATVCGKAAQVPSDVSQTEGGPQPERTAPVEQRPVEQRPVEQRPVEQRPAAPTACAANAGLRSVAAVPSRRGLRFGFERSIAGPVTVDVLQQSRGRRVVGERLVARFGDAQSGLGWNGRATVARRTVRDGYYVARFTLRTPTGRAVRRVALRRADGRFAARPAYAHADTCAAVERFKLERPVFGGRGARSLGIALRLTRASDARIEVLRGTRVVRSFTRRVDAGRTARLRVGAKGLRRGDYRVRVTVAGAQSPAPLVARRL